MLYLMEESFYINNILGQICSFAGKIFSLNLLKIKGDNTIYLFLIIYQYILVEDIVKSIIFRFWSRQSAAGVLWTNDWFCTYREEK